MITRRHIRHFVFYPFSALTGLITVTWFVTPYVAEHVLTSYFKEQNLALSISSLSVDFFPPRIDLKNVVISDETQDTFTLERALFKVEMWPLFTKTVRISEAQITGLTLDLKQKENDWIVAGINTTQYRTDNSDTDSGSDTPDSNASDETVDASDQNQSTPWSIILPSFSFTDSQVNLARQPDLTTDSMEDTFTLSSLKLNNVSGKGLNWKGKIALATGVNASILSLNSQFNYTPEQTKADIRLDKTRLLIEDFRHFIPAPFQQSKGQLDLEIGLTLALQQADDILSVDTQNLNISANASDLELFTSDNADNRITSKSTAVSLVAPSFQYSDEEHLSGEGKLSVRSELTSLLQNEQRLGFDSLQLNAPFNAEKSGKQASMTGTVNVQSDKLAFSQNDQTLEYSQLSLNSPVKIQQDDQALSATGHLNLQIQDPAFQQADQNAQLKSLSLDAPFNIKQDDLGIAATGALDLTLLNTLFTQADQKAQFESFTLRSPFDVKQNDTGIDAIVDLTADLQKALFSQGNQQVELDQLQLVTPFTFTQGENALSASGSLDIKAINADLAQADQTVRFENATLTTPFDISQNNTGLTATLAETQLNLNTLSLAMTDLALQNQTLQLSLNQVAFSMDDKQDITLSLATTLESSGFDVQQANNKATFDRFALTNTLDLQKKGDALLLQNSQLETRIDGLRASQDEQRILLDSALLTADAFNVDIQGEQAPAINGDNVTFSSAALDTFLSPEQRAASWSSADVSGVSFSQQGDLFELALAQLNIDNLTVSEFLSDTTPSPLPPLSKITKISVTDVNADQEGAKIKQITLDSFDIKAFIGEQKQLENLVFVSEETPTSSDNTSTNVNTDGISTEKTDAPEQTAAIKAPYYIILDAYDTTGESKISVQDKSIAPMLQRSVEIDTLSLRNLNTRDKQQATVLAFKARNDKYATLSGDVTLWPLADRLTLNSEFVVREAELPPFSSYIASVLGYQIDSGQLDLDLTLNAKEGVLDGKSNIVLREFELGGRKESSSVIKAGAVPLNIAVGILKDSDNNIDLDIPFSGDIDNPEFGWRDFLFLPVRKALYTASSSYLMQTFIPYANVISIAQFAGDQLLKIRVEPLIFEPEADTLSEAQDPFLTQLAALMKDKKDSQLKACGITSYRDLGFETPPSELDSETQARGKALALLRANELKDYLVKADIPSSRVFVCSPEIDLSKNSKPRIELNF
ncbi:DUF748 domain-containing protein [Marinomonas sp. A79]|uniref:DUF748 domain-containing protein n=1 Tax=Marinomonas vulgaris TaxID=2823372 RepID=A0ABS5HDH4_9GAMM|nr:DUF748 domain-containing protein [Marinomonas vulgaris]MBR7889547.1 DUF748 domain-containing protein [Marinomonas vulgaris]